MFKVIFEHINEYDFPTEILESKKFTTQNHITI